MTAILSQAMAAVQDAWWRQDVSAPVCMVFLQCATVARQRAVMGCGILVNRVMTGTKTMEMGAPNRVESRAVAVA
jgi:hypothetical protein